MDLLTLDLECYYDSEYSLSKMTTEAYLRDPRFEEILWSVKWNDSESFWILPERAAAFFQEEIDWANVALITHHAHFDGARLSWFHGCRPALHIDTLSMARIIDGPKAGNSLQVLCERHGIGAKGDYVTFAKGKRLADFATQELFQYGQYGCNDADRTYDLAQIFLPQLPYDELRLIDQTVRMFTEPVLRGDAAKLRTAALTERTRKREMLERLGLTCLHCGGSGQEVAPPGVEAPACRECGGLGVDRGPLNSNDKFAELLRARGVEPETKRSPTDPEKRIFAFARTDAAMQELLEDEDEEVRVLAEARVAVKSTIIESRAEKLAACAERGPVPVYLKHAGAHTLRPSGGDGMNMLNMSKRNASRPEMMVLRQSIVAPPGYKIVAPDSGQGEARIVAWLAKQLDLVDAFAQGRDIYSEFASDVYGRPVDRKRVKEDEIPGQVGKICILGYGFGMGWYKSAAEFLKGALGNPPIQFTLADAMALQVDVGRFCNNPKKVARVVEMPSRLDLNARLVHCAVTEALNSRYRQRYKCIPAYWDAMEAIINHMIRGEDVTFGAHGVLRTGKECIHLPNGMRLDYRGLERDSEGVASYWDGRKRTKIHGPLLTENMVQCLHRLIVGHQLLRIADAGIKIVLWPYDEVVAVVPEDSAELALEYMVQEMKRPPAWAAGLPLTAEGKIGDTYAEC